MTPAESKISMEYARECFEHRGGELFWRERPAHHFERSADHQTFIKKSAGKIAGRKERTGYLTLQMRLNGERLQFQVHRVIWALHHGKWPVYTIDHINRNRRDNRVENMRDVSMAENLCNRGNPNGTGIPGVLRAGGKFQAKLRVGDNYIHLGTFGDTDGALQARLRAETAALAALDKVQQAPLLPLRVLEMTQQGEQQ